VKAAVAAGIRVEAVPGASAILTALVASGLPTNAFTFAGFPPPRDGARERWFDALATRTETLVFFESPHRIRETLASALRVLGDRPALVGRELTKVHETLVRGPISSILASLGEPRGEFTVVIGPPTPVADGPGGLPDGESLLAEFYHLTETANLGRREAVARLAERYVKPVREVYATIERAKKLRD
jgi:16S rRNA (cytidine1402-2'-O)-methyltransferase